ncbi:PRA1 family protein H [Macadamia integrifolia]|uniref:PRA1 family protein H n=1 Tax=Macadamia integrifolia TaxID=60698 RepID=UPI001C4EB689|nr:PRA1 family protein H [Macadamia integrifolia]XP_042491052.1 PRA1 family protein H [Macadamia integrifolia]
MAFLANPLSLSVPEAAFESWLRDSGYLEVLDERTTILDLSFPSDRDGSSTSIATSPSSATNYSFFHFIFSYLGTLFSLFTLNPFAKLTSDDFAGDAPSWTIGFFGCLDSYSIPSSPSQARLRVQENVKRYARNYATLAVIIFAIALYQIPVALLGLISCLALWDLFRFCSDKWGLERYPSIRQSLVRIAQFATAVVLYCTQVQLALFCAVGVSYAVLVLHASLRKLTTTRLLTQADGHKRFQQSKYRS